MRRPCSSVLRVSGDDAAERRAQPRLADLDALAAPLRAAGLDVELVVEGDAPLAPSIDLSAFRIVQEALTNTLKHAGPRRATLTVRYAAATRSSVEVTDDGGGAAHGRRRHAGTGCSGMRERVALLGGSLDGRAATRRRLPGPRAVCRSRSRRA